MERKVLDRPIAVRTIFVRHWESFAFRGGVAIAFGLIAFAWPGMTLAALVLLFAVYALLDGIAAIVIGTRQRAREHAWAVLLEGLAGVGLGLAALVWTRTPAELIVDLVALWAIATGLLELFAAKRLGCELPGQALIGVGGVASMLLGFTILLWPTAGALALVVLLGSYALVFGTAMLVHALRLRTAMQRLEHDEQHSTTPRLLVLRREPWEGRTSEKPAATRREEERKHMDDSAPQSNVGSKLRRLATSVASRARRMATLAAPSRVGQLMTRSPRTCTPSDSLQHAAHIMWEADCGCVPVVDADGRALAMVTDRDICMAAYTQGRSLEEISVSSAASRTLVAARDDDPVVAAERLMQENRIRRLAVVDASGRLVGVLSLSDVVRHARFWFRRSGLGSDRIASTFAAICQPASPPHAGAPPAVAT